MLNLFEPHYSELMQSDLDQKTKDRNWQIVISYFGDIEALIAQAKRGFRGHSEEKKQRNAALIETLAFIGMRRSELLGLWVTESIPPAGGFGVEAGFHSLLLSVGNNLRSRSSS